MRLTRKKAIAITIELWAWLAKTGVKDKFEWPRWDKYGEMQHSCPLCEYGYQRMEARKAHMFLSSANRCRSCPFFKKFGSCLDFGFENTADPAYYKKWYLAETKRMRKKYAALFLKQLKQL